MIEEDVIMAKLNVLNPVANTVVTKRQLADRLPDLNAKRVGLYWNGKGGGDIALRAIGEQLQRRFTDVQVEMIHSAIPGPKEKVEAGKGFNLVVGSTGD